jgi:tyrosinase
MPRDIRLSRRNALLGTAAATASLWLSHRPGWSATTSVRPDIASPAGQKMVAQYAEAVKAMQDPAINYPPQPQSWTFQAYIHAVPANPFDPADSGGLGRRNGGLQKRIDQIYGQPAAGTPQADWKKAALACWATCQHASPYFTTWHRWYLYYFERICRKLSNNPDFVLPYWNYGSDTGPSLQLPDQFITVSQDPSQPNVLFFDDRGLGFADGQATGPQNVAMNNGGFLPYPLTQYGPALSTNVMFPSDDSSNINTDPTQPGYLAFGHSGRLECAPHDNVHSYVGGWMQNVPSAAGDPIFYMHHCQIDRLYASWEAMPGSTYNWGDKPTQPAEQTWKSKPASFVDENGHLVQVKLGDAISTSALDYDYDHLVPPAHPALASLFRAGAPRAAPVTVAAMETKNFDVQSGGSTVVLQPSANAASSTALGGPAGNTPQILVLKGIKLLRRPPAPLSVFINMPKGTTPRLHNAFYVGTLNLFNFDLGTGTVMSHDEASDHADHDMAGPEARFDVTDILRRQRASGTWDGGPVSVTISTLGADTPANTTYVTIESATIVP